MSNRTNSVQLNQSNIMVLTIQEKVEIITLTRSFSYQKTAEVFNRSHINRPNPINKQTVARIVKHLRLRGSLHRKRRTVSDQNSLALQGRVEDEFNRNPHASIGSFTRHCMEITEKNEISSL